MTQAPEEIIVDETETAEEEGTQIDKGIVIFHKEDGTVQYQLIGQVTLENITYYRRFLDEIEKGFWNEKTKGTEG